MLPRALPTRNVHNLEFFLALPYHPPRPIPPRGKFRCRSRHMYLLMQHHIISVLRLNLFLHCIALRPRFDLYEIVAARSTSFFATSRCPTSASMYAFARGWLFLKFATGRGTVVTAAAELVQTPSHRACSPSAALSHCAVSTLPQEDGRPTPSTCPSPTALTAD
jgi:hypothetical protein